MLPGDFNSAMGSEGLGVVGGVNHPKDKEERLIRTLTIYVCTMDGCPAFFGINDEASEYAPDLPNGDHGWDPDGWPHCSEHSRPMRPVRVEAVRTIPHQHPAGCFYGSFMDAYPDAWHIPHGADCRLDHGEKPIRLERPGGEPTYRPDSSARMTRRGKRVAGNHRHAFGAWQDDPAGVVRVCDCGAVESRPEG